MHHYMVLKKYSFAFRFFSFADCLSSLVLISSQYGLNHRSANDPALQSGEARLRCIVMIMI